MGLDMYLKARRYVSEYDEGDRELSMEVKQKFPELREETIQGIDIRVGYWRKANAIHRWFVEHVQEGQDDCGDYWCSVDHLKDLKAVCERVLAFRHLAVEQLPTTEGFFFGSTDYDEFYFKDLEYTVKVVDRAIELAESGKWDIEYHSSW